MNCKDSFLKVKVTAQMSKYIFKIGDKDIDPGDDYTVVESGKVCSGPYIIFKDKEQMYKFQEDNKMNKYKPFLYNCNACDYHTKYKSSYDRHIESNKCREVRGLEPLLNSEKSRYSGSKSSYYCNCCNYSPKTKTNRNLMRNHSRSKKHITNCEKAGVEVDYCLTPVVE